MKTKTQLLSRDAAGDSDSNYSSKETQASGLNPGRRIKRNTPPLMIIERYTFVPDRRVDVTASRGLQLLGPVKLGPGCTDARDSEDGRSLQSCWMVQQFAIQRASLPTR